MDNRKYFPDIRLPNGDYLDWSSKILIDTPPIWCSVDLRDGNQALAVPMSLESKLEFFKMLVRLGFKEIEVGFPASNDTEFSFCRTLIEGGLIPSDVSIQVLTQSREHIIRRTFEAVEGAENVIIHLYNATSPVFRQRVFKKNRAEMTELATSGARLCLEYAEKSKSNIRFEYSPEAFSATEMDFALEICSAVLNIWKPTPEHKCVINLPETVGRALPHIYARQIEFMSKSLPYRDGIVLSLHTHNDRGCAVADCEMGLIAGGERVEGTLFGNGERTGNADIVTIALNMLSQGVDPMLDFSQLPEVVSVYENLTSMQVGDRQPYSGALVFAAFSGSHQDAIAKGMHWREENGEYQWNMPYLTIDPNDLGRRYQSDVIRINSQSGKGGISFVLEECFGFDLPARMREDFGYYAKAASDHSHRELEPSQVYELFESRYLNVASPFELSSVHFVQHPDGKIGAALMISANGMTASLHADGNGRLDAVSNAIRQSFCLDFTLSSYEEHALTVGSQSKAAAYVSVTGSEIHWGAGVDNDIIVASVKALFSAINNLYIANDGAAKVTDD